MDYRPGRWLLPVTRPPLQITGEYTDIQTGHDQLLNPYSFTHHVHLPLSFGAKEIHQFNKLNI